MFSAGNRAVALALILAVVPSMAQAQVSESPEDKQRRIDTFQERRLIYEKVGTSYQLRQGPDAIYDKDFVELMADPSLTRYWLGERNRDYTIWLGIGLTALPAGGVLFYQNFRGEGLLAFFADPSRPQGANSGDWRTFALSVAGVTLAAYGLYNLGQWIAEEMDWRHPARLEESSVEPRVREWNERLADRLNLEPEDLPSPPTPRPSVSPSPSASPGGLFSPASPPVTGPDAYPMGEPPEAVPMPLPVIEPGAVPPLEASPGPSPSPYDFRFPGATPWPSASPSPS